MAAPTPQDLQQGVPASANVVKRVAAPGGGEYLLDANGGVYAIGGASYQGSYWDDRYLDPKHRVHQNLQFKDIVLDPNGGYKLLYDDPSGSGRVYDYNLAPAFQQMNPGWKPPAPKPKPNTLYSDPGFLAFMRSSDLELETAAQQVARQQDALRRALGLQETQIKDQGVQDRQNIANSFEARGVFRSGMNAVKQAEAEQRMAADLAARKRETANQISGLSESLASKVAEQQRAAGEKGYGVAGQQDLAARQEALRAKYPASFGGQS